MSTTQQDSVLRGYIAEEKARQIEGLELIASENFVSDEVLFAAGTVLTNKYAEGYTGNRYYGGCEVVDKVETLAIERVKKIFNCEYVNVQPHSGSQANASVLFSFMKPGDKLMGLSLAMGGHLTHGAHVSFSGKIYHAISYGLNKDTMLIDYDEMEQTAKKEKPRIIICGGSSYSRDWDYARMRAIADSVGAMLWCDMAHPAGLIAKKLLNNPFEHCHFVTTTTHKTLRGPRGGMILMPKDFENKWGFTNNKGRVRMMSELLNLAVFPGQQGGPLMHIIAAKAACFKEVLSDGFTTYAKNVIANARAMQKHFTTLGYTVVSGGTDNHLFLLDLNNKNITGKEAEAVLGKAGITVNKNTIPFDTRSPFVTSGIRIGSPAITTRGLREADMEFVVNYIDESLKNKDNDAKLAQIKEKVHKEMSARPLFTW